MKIYLVGGAVRDKMLGLPVRERDWVVVGASVAEMESLGYKQVGKSFPVFLHPQTGEEYALARTERKTGPGYKGFSVDATRHVTLEQDLQRRDLTINAMAEDDTGRLIDPCGGAADLRAGVLRHVSPAFVEDPVRVLRAARFAARFGDRGFQVAVETRALMQTMVQAGEVDALVAERVAQEMEKALGEPAPQRFFAELRACGALARIFPEIDRLFGVPQRADYHPEIDSGEHTLMVLQQAARLSTDKRVRFAALVHDLGKAETPAAELPSHHGHEQRGVPLVRGLCQRIRLANDYRDLAVLVTKYHLHAFRIAELRAATILDTLEALDALRRPERLQQFLLACEADALGRGGEQPRSFLQGQQWLAAHAAAAAINAADLVARGLSGAALGEQLRRERIAAIERLRA